MRRRKDTKKGERREKLAELKTRKRKEEIPFKQHRSCSVIGWNLHQCDSICFGHRSAIYDTHQNNQYILHLNVDIFIYVSVDTMFTVPIEYYEVHVICCITSKIVCLLFSTMSDYQLPSFEFCCKKGPKLI